mgnify:CR=1 FL=1
MIPPRKAHLFVALAVSLLAAPCVQAAWIWSPQTGWVGPGGAVKDSPEEQLVFAIRFFEQKEYDRARAEFRKLVKAYKESHEASEGQYYLGRCEEERGDHYKAFLEYRKTIQVYPSTKRFDEILQREYQMGDHFLAGKKRKIFGTVALLPARDKAVEIFQAIAEDGPFSEQGQLAQYKLGVAHLALQDYEAAVGAFDQLITRYPESSMVDDARYQIALASLKGTFKPQYDQSTTLLAIRQLENFLQTYPGGELAGQATARLEELKSRSAEHDYLVAQFYERRRRPASALMYYASIMDQRSDTPWAPKAAERIQVIEKQL